MKADTLQTMVRIRPETRKQADAIAEKQGWTLTETFERGIQSLGKQVFKPRRPKPAA